MEFYYMVFKVAIIIMLLMFVYLKLTQKYVNPYKTILIFGKKGSGKTCHIAKMSTYYKRKGYNVYTTCDIPGTIHLDPKHIGYYAFKPHSVLFVDEVGTIWDNRHFKDFTDEQRDFFIFQRQDKLITYLYSQTYNDVDLKIRTKVDSLWLLENKARVFSVCRRINKVFTVGQTADGEGTITESYEFAFPFFGGMNITFIPRWVDMFDTNYLATNKRLKAALCNEVPEPQDYDLMSKYYLTKKFIHNKLTYIAIRLSLIKINFKYKQL